MSIGEKIGRYAGRYVGKAGSGTLIAAIVYGAHKLGQGMAQNPIACEAAEIFGKAGTWGVDNAYWTLPILVAAPIAKYAFDKAEGLERRVRE